MSPNPDLRWIVYYDDDSTYSNLDGLPENAPKRGVQIIAQVDPDTGHSYVKTADFYWYVPDSDLPWTGGDIFGWTDYQYEPGWKLTLFGRMISNREYERIVNIAQSNTDLPPKSAWRPSERRVV